MNFKRSVSMVLAAAALSAPGVISAQALEYNYTSGVSQGFYQSTSVSTNAISDSGKIVVGSDGTIAANTSGNVTSSPLVFLFIFPLLFSHFSCTFLFTLFYHFLFVLKVSTLFIQHQF